MLCQCKQPVVYGDFKTKQSCALRKEINILCMLGVRYVVIFDVNYFMLTQLLGSFEDIEDK